MSFAKQVAFKVSRAVAGRRPRSAASTRSLPAKDFIPTSWWAALLVFLLVFLFVAQATDRTPMPRRYSSASVWEFAPPEGKEQEVEEAREWLRQHDKEVAARVRAAAAAREGGVGQNGLGR